MILELAGSPVRQSSGWPLKNEKRAPDFSRLSGTDRRVRAYEIEFHHPAIFRGARIQDEGQPLRREVNGLVPALDVKIRRSVHLAPVRDELQRQFAEIRCRTRRMKGKNGGLP